MHDAGLERLASDGYGRVVLWMLSTNRRAAAFYRRRGWVADGHLRLQQFGGDGGPRPASGAVAPGGVTGRSAGGPAGQIFSRPSQ